MDCGSEVKSMEKSGDVEPKVQKNEGKAMPMSIEIRVMSIKGEATEKG